MINKNIEKSIIFEFICQRLNQILKSNKIKIKDEMILVGENNIIKSAELFELFMDIEVYLKDFNLIFDWPNMIVELSNNNTNISIKQLINYIFNKNEIK
tara:strand:+ start:236 stop:532 length:297 start_codon:yes stop_codon:yes gene_type:complete